MCFIWYKQTGDKWRDEINLDQAKNIHFSQCIFYAGSEMMHKLPRSLSGFAHIEWLSIKAEYNKHTLQNSYGAPKQHDMITIQGT